MSTANILALLGLMAVIVPILVGLGIWCGRIYERQQAHDDRLTKMEQEVEEMKGGQNRLEVHVAVVRNSITDMQSSLHKLEQSMEGLRRELSNSLMGSGNKFVEFRSAKGGLE